MNKCMFCLLAVLLLGREADAQGIAPFKAGEKVVFIGNSITEHGYYESYIWLYYMLHYPGRRITVYNGGIGGDRAKEMNLRMQDDAFSKKPSVICLTFGMNDSDYFAYLSGGNTDSIGRVRADSSHYYFNEIIAKIKADQVKNPSKKIIIAGSLYDETMKNPKGLFPGKSKSMELIAAFQQKAAVDNHWGFVDFFHPMTEITLREQQKNPEFTLTSSDRIHPGNQGHFVMAYLFLKNQGMAGKVVADVVVDAGSKVVARSENCTLTNVSMKKDEVSFDYLANSLPFPQDTLARLWENPHKQAEALSVIPFNDEMNREMLTVRGLSEGGHYGVTMDGKSIGSWTGAELGAGVNLALVKSTPEYEQAMSVLWLNEERMQVESKIRQYYWLQYNYFRNTNQLYQDDARAMDSVLVESQKNWAVASKRDNYRAARYPAVRATWQKEMDLLANEIYTINKPRTHKVVIKAL